MIVVYVDTMEDTSTFKTIYKDIECTILLNPKREEVVKILEQNPTETLLGFGHGSANGLFSSHENELFVIDKDMVPLLKNREVIGIWCYANQFGIKYNLKGFFTYMFISNVEEAISFCMKNWDREIIYSENRRFADSINKFLKDKKPLCEWVDALNEDYSLMDFVKFNYSNLCYLDGE